MSLGILQFQPQLLPTIVALVLIPLFLGLGFWQLERADGKRELAATLGSRIAAPALRLDAATHEFDTIEYRPVAAHGQLLEAQTIYIQNRKYRGKNGFHVVTPLRLDDNRHLLVNRGWVAASEPHRPPPVATPAEPVTIVGQASIPAAPVLDLQPRVDTTQHVWPYLTVVSYAEWSGLELLPFVLLQTSDDDAGLVRRWPQPATGDGMHIGYAIQWFAFALIALAIWLKLSLVRRPVEADE